MKFNTAVCFFLLGTASFLRQRNNRSRLWQVLTSLAGLIAVLTAIEILFHVNLGIDQLIFQDRFGSVATDAPGRMSGFTSLSFILLSAAMLLENKLGPRRQFLAAAAFILGLSVLLSYPFGLAFGTSLFSYSGMAFNSSLLFIFLSLSLLLLDRGWLDLVFARNVLAENTRNLLITVLAVPFLLGWLFFYGEQVGWFNPGIARSSFTVAVMVLLAVIVVLNAGRLQRAETAHSMLLSDFANVQQRLQVLIENSPAAIFIKGVDGRYQLVNSHFEGLVGKERGEIVGRKADAIFKRQLLPAVQASEKQVLETKGVSVTEISAELNGELRTYLNTVFPLIKENGEVESIGGIWTDITGQKQLAVSLESKNIDLERSNKELEQFAYVASHDLQEPLRMVSSYMQLLESRYGEKLDDDAKEFIAYAVDGAARMQRLIQDLLAFSRIGTRGKDPEPVEAEKAVADALQNLKVRIEENKAKVTYAKLPTLLADPNQLTQLFQNLIGNAIKFKGEKSPSIEINSKNVGDFAEFSVKDNGIGFDQRHADRIFVLFQRLNNRTEYEGTGIGLAICKKIVERHGGKIWVETQPGKGTTFFFTFPRPAADVDITGAADDATAIEAKPAESVEERAGRLI